LRSFPSTRDTRSPLSGNEQKRERGTAPKIKEARTSRSSAAERKLVGLAVPFLDVLKKRIKAVPPPCRSPPLAVKEGRAAKKGEEGPYKKATRAAASGKKPFGDAKVAHLVLPTVHLHSRGGYPRTKEGTVARTAKKKTDHRGGTGVAPGGQGLSFIYSFKSILPFFEVFRLGKLLWEKELVAKET